MKIKNFNSYLSGIALISVLFFGLPMALGTIGELPTAGSYIRALLCFFILTIVSASLLLGKRYVKFYSLSFFVIALLGLVHYILLINPSYFNSNGGPVDTFWGEFQSVFNNVGIIIENKKTNGLFYFNRQLFEVAHPEIWHIISFPMFFLENKWMNYSPLNVFSMQLTSMNIMLVYNRFNPGVEGNKNNARKILLYTSAFFPMGLLNGIMWRDPFGMLLISTGLVLITLSNSFFSSFFSFITLTVFSFVQRAVYGILSVGTVLFKEFTDKKRVLPIIYIPLTLVALFIVTQYFQESTNENYVTSYVNEQSFLYFPIKLLTGMIGPFPWTQFSQYFMGNLSMAYQPADYLIGTFQLGYLFALIMNWKNFSFKNLDYMTVMGFSIMLSGFMTRHLHVGYIYEGLYFTLPWFFKQIGSKYWKYFGYAFVLLVMLNIVAIGIGGFGVSSSWK